MARRTRRTQAGTLAPGDAYAPSLFEEYAPPPAPLALFALDPVAPAGPILTPRCAVCDDGDHQADRCHRGAALDLFTPDGSTPPAVGIITAQADAPEVPAPDVDNTPETVEARREMFAGLGWNVSR